MSAAMIVVPVGISYAFRLRQESKLAVAALRCLVQLGTLGYLLVPIFKYDYLWVVLGYFFVPMSATAAWEGVGRPSWSYKGMTADAWLCITLPVIVVLSYGLLAIVSVTPWWQARARGG